MMKIAKIDIQPYLEIFWRRKMWIVGSLCVSVLLGMLYIYGSKEMYRASTLILVESQRVPSSYVKSTISESLNARLRTITQQVNSRTNLESIINGHELFSVDKNVPEGWGEKAKTWLQELLGPADGVAQEQSEEIPSILSQVNQVREKINVQLRGGNRAIEISFEWNDPQIAADVANAIASQFIEQNLKVREEMAMGTTDFLTTEVIRLRQQLVEKERALEKFKKAHMGRLPSQLGSNLNVLNQLKEERNNLEKRIDTEKQQAILLQNQINALQEKDEERPKEEFDSQEKSDLTKYKNRLEHLRTRYTADHPDVLAMKRRIAALEKEQAMEGTATAAAGTQGELSLYEERAEELQTQLQTEVWRRIANYESKIQEVNAEIQQYRERVEGTSQVELELKDLQRDYDAVNARYQGLLSKKFSAQMSEEMEKRQKGEQFRVVDAAVAPSAPFAPNVQKIMALVLVLGLGIGGGMAYLRESLDPGFYTEEEIESYLETDVVVSFPIEGYGKSQKKKRRK